MKTACVAFAYGCPRSEIDACTLTEYLKANGWALTNNFRDADLLFLSACGFNDYAEEKSIKFFEIIEKRKRNNVQVIIFGCLSGINASRIQELGAIPIPPTEMEKLDILINAKVKLKEIDEPNILDDYKLGFSQCLNGIENLLIKSYLWRNFLDMTFFRFFYGRGPMLPHKIYNKIFHIRIARGCLETCSYCAIRFACGTLGSKSLDSVLSEFRSGLEKGYRTFRLVAGDVGAYGQDIGTNIVELLRTLCDHEGNFQLIFDDFNPTWLIQYLPELNQIFERNRDKFGYLGFPLQSGSNKILKSMKRRYAAEDVLKSFLSLKSVSPDLNLTTHVLVGFPGETEDDFLETIEFLKAARFTYLSAYKYCDRPKTVASQLATKIPKNIMNSRLRRLRRQFPKICRAN